MRAVYSRRMFVGVDIGGTSMRATAVGALADPVLGTVEKTAAPASYEQGLASLIEIIAKVSAAPTAIGIGIAGALTPARDAITAAGTLTGWLGKPLLADLQQAFDCPIVLGNDAEAAALAEATYGPLSDDFWFLIWGTGVGATFLSQANGAIEARPSEPGHIMIDFADDLEPDGCGRSGCLESFVGGGGIARRYGRPAAELSEEQWERVCSHFAEGIYTLMLVAPTTHVVMGGGISIKQHARLPRIEQMLRERLTYREPPRVKAAEQGEEAGLYGALALLVG